MINDHLADIDPLALFEAAEQAKLNTENAERKFRELTRRVFRTQSGRDWLKLAMQRYNFNGSVFTAEDMDPLKAAHRDGMRAVLSDILNSAARTNAPS